MTGGDFKKRLREALAMEYDKRYRMLIIDSLEWLDGQEPGWKLDKPLDRRKFIDNLLESVVKDDLIERT